MPIELLGSENFSPNIVNLPNAFGEQRTVIEFDPPVEIHGRFAVGFVTNTPMADDTLILYQGAGGFGNGENRVMRKLFGQTVSGADPWFKDPMWQPSFDYDLMIIPVFELDTSTNLPPPPLVAIAGQNQTICLGQSVELGGHPSAFFGTPPYTFSWSPTTNLSCTTCQNPMADPSTNTTYTLSVTDSTGTVVTVDVTVTVNALPATAFSVATNGLDLTSTNTTTNTTTNATSYVWDMGDGQMYFQQDVNHTYSADGNYNVCLWATNSCGTDSICSQVTVGCAAAVANFGFQVVGTSVILTDASTNATIWQWDYGDGSAPGFGQSQTHTYADSGNYTVCLFAFNNCSVDTNCQQVYIAPIDTGDFIAIIEGGASIRLFPNPANEVLTVSVEHLNGSFLEIEMLTLDGRTVLDKRFEASSAIEENLDISNLPVGTYLMNFRTKSGNTSGKFVVVR